MYASGLEVWSALCNWGQEEVCTQCTQDPHAGNIGATVLRRRHATNFFTQTNLTNN
jgi:hypothetical protein